MDWKHDRIAAALKGENPTVLRELPGGFAAIGDTQFLPGYCVLLGKDPHVSAWIELPRRERVQFLADADLLAQAVAHACRQLDPGFRRVNVEVLGNADSFIHAHVWPRYSWESEPEASGPVWWYDSGRWSDPRTALGEHHAELRERICTELDALVQADSPRSS